MKKSYRDRHWHEQRRRMIDSIQIYDEDLTLDDVYDCVREKLWLNDEDPCLLSRNNLEAMMVNFIRHENTTYDEALDRMDRIYRKAPSGEKDLTYHMIRNAVLTKIAQKYPKLSAQCDKQKWPVALYKTVG